jgi:sugar lactone lactonase YvrE
LQTRFPRAGAALAAALLALAGAAADQPLGDADARTRSLEFQKKALAAYQAKDWPAFLENAKQASALRPGEPRILYTLACAQARNGHASEAAKILEGLIGRTLDFGSATDDDFAAVRDAPEFAGVRRGLAGLARPLGGSAVAFRLPEKDLLTEGIAYDPASKAFFVSSVHRRKIVRRTPDGKVSDFVREGQDGIHGVLALAVDSPRRRLLACSAALPQMAGYDKSLEGASALYSFDLATGKLLRRDPLPADGKPHAANDLLVEANGDVLVTDSLGAGIYRFRAAGGPVETLVPPGVFRSPQGIVFGPGGRVYVADWGYGLYWLTDGGQRREVTGPPDAPLFGIDGLIASGRRFYVTQNGLAPERVTRLELDASGERVVAAKILDMNDPEFAEPTLLTLVGKDLYVVGKSQWPAFDEKTGAFDPAKLVEPAILKIGIGDQAPR